MIEQFRFSSKKMKFKFTATLLGLFFELFNISDLRRHGQVEIGSFTWTEIFLVQQS